MGFGREGAWRTSWAMPVALALVAGGALAHVPGVAPDERVIAEPWRSWAFFDTLPPQGEHAWTFTLSRGDPLVLHVAVPVEAAWTPAARLVGPAGEIPLEPEAGVGIEPVTPYASRSVWGLDARAPASGTYVLTISGDGGNYALGYGLAEVFTPTEWIGVPLAALRIHAWEGRSAAALAIPWVLALLVAAIVPLPGPGPVARAAAGLFAGTVVDRFLQLAVAIDAGGQMGPWGWAFGVATLVPPALLAAAAWSARAAWDLAAVGLVGLATWSGLLVGPILVLALALLRPLARGTARERPAA